MSSSLSRLVALLTTTLLASSSLAQSLTGIWRGYFITDAYEQYKFEVQIEQNGPSLQGVSYSYLTTIFYGKAAVKGSYESTSKRVRLQETHTLELKMSEGSHSCIMDCNLMLNRSGNEEFLEGTYTSQFEKNAPGVRKGADCGDGKVYLRRVTESDFYQEPFLKNQSRKEKPVYDNQAPPDRNKLGTKTDSPPNASTKKTEKPPLQEQPTKSTPPPAKKEPTPPPTPTEDPTPSVLKNRENELSRELTVNNRTIRIRLYDNGEIDGDTISVYVGKKLVLSRKRLTANALEISFEIPAGATEEQVTMVAENLGSIPPNTSLMIVEVGDERFEVRITSTEQKNAVVRFRYKPN